MGFVSSDFPATLLISFSGLRITDDTEIGDNATIKSPPPIQSSRRARKMEQDGTMWAIVQSIELLVSETHARHPENAALPSTPPRNFSALKKAHKTRTVPELLEKDLVESFVRGEFVAKHVEPTMSADQSTPHREWSRGAINQ